MIPGLGTIGCRKLLAAYPDEDIFALPARELALAFGAHRQPLEAILHKSTHARAEEELRWCEKQGVKVLFCSDSDFPQRLNREETADCPVVLYVLGDADLNSRRVLAVVGTRKATLQGRDNTSQVVAGLQPLGVTVVSGLAYGIDKAAHQAALDNGMPTVGVLGHGLDRIYPPEHRQLASDILSHGGALVSEYPSGTGVNPHHFPARNRIIAALADATVVVEAARKGGALITATIATGYQREVFAVPGRLSDTYSVGTNALIATSKAQLVRGADDVAYQMGWPLPKQGISSGVQQQLFPTLSDEAQRLVDILYEQGDMGMDQLMLQSCLSMPKVASLLFELETAGLVRPLPGSMYQAVARIAQR